MTEPNQILQSRADEWTRAIFERRSRRAYDNHPADPAAVAQLTALAETFRPYPDARVAVLPESPEDMFTGIVGSYGRITGAVSALVFVGSGEATGRDNHVGYVSEALLLEATALGLGTVWVGGGIDREHASGLLALGADERVLGASPLGQPVAEKSVFGRPKREVATLDRRKPLDVIAPAMSDAWPAWARRAVEHAQWAPSAVNRQPWRFAYEDGGLVVRVAGREFVAHLTRRLDAGIAMLHAELGALTEGVTGTWTDLEGTDIARFDPLGA